MPETRCPECGEHKERIAGHWAMSSCEYPQIEGDRRAVVDGLVLAGGTIAGNGSNRHVTIGTTSETLAEWTADRLGWLCHSVRRETSEGREDVYRVRTPAHPQLNRYERWDKLEDSSGRAPPESFTLSPVAGRVWWAYAGGLEWPTDYDSGRSGTLSAANDDKREWIVRVLDDVGIDATPADRRAKLAPSQLDEWLEWIGEPVPGAAHKWAESAVFYQAGQTEPATEGEFRTAVATAALEVARDRTDQVLTPDLFDERVDAVDSADVADWLGGGSWEDSCRVAGVSMHRRRRQQGDDGDDKPPSMQGWYGRMLERDYEYVNEGDGLGESTLLEALELASADIDGNLSVSKYDKWADGRDVPSSWTISHRIGWNEAKRRVGLDTVPTRNPDQQ